MEYGRVSEPIAAGWLPRRIEVRLREHPEWSDRLIANQLGCSHTTVAEARKGLEAGAQIAHVDRHLGLDGKWYKIARQTPPPEGGWGPLIEARLREHPEWADRLIANKLGCSHTTVAVVRKELEAGAQIGHLDRLLGLDGKWYKVRRKPKGAPARQIQV